MSGEGVTENAVGEQDAVQMVPEADYQAVLAECARQADLIAAFQASRDAITAALTGAHLAPEGGWDAVDLSAYVPSLVTDGLKAIEGLNEKIVELTNERGELSNQLAAAKAAAERGAADFEEVSKQRDNLATELTEVKAALAKAAKSAKSKVTVAPKAPKLRGAGPIDKPVDSDGLLKAVQDRPHVLVFSDGETELAALDAVMVQGASAWRRRGRGVLLTEPVRIKPNVTVELAGFALFDARGKQVAWGSLSQPIRIAAGQEVKLDNQVLFA